MKRRNTELKNFVGLFSYYMNKRSTGDANSCEIKIVAGGHALGAYNVESNNLYSIIKICQNNYYIKEV